MTEFDINMIYKTAEYVSVKLCYCLGKYKMMDDVNAEGKMKCIKETLDPLLKSPLLDRLKSLISTMKEINKEPISSVLNLSSVSTIRDEMGRLSSESSSNENNTSEDDQTPPPAMRYRKNFQKTTSKNFQSFGQALLHLNTLLYKLNLRAKSSRLTDKGKKKWYALMGLNAVNESDIFPQILSLQEEYKKIQIELASTSDPTDPSISNATPMSSPNPQNSNESTDILGSFANLRDEIEKLNEKPVEK